LSLLDFCCVDRAKVGRPDPGAEQEGAKFRDPADGQKNKLIECSIAWAIAIGVPAQEAAAALYCASGVADFGCRRAVEAIVGGDVSPSPKAQCLGAVLH